jgi:hypothetical protein
LRRYGQGAQNSLREFIEEATEAISKSLEKGQDFFQAKKSFLAEAIGGTGEQTPEGKKK